MAIAGVITPVITITLTLPNTRVDGTTLNLSDIASATILRDSGSGPVAQPVINGPFNSESVVTTDASPASGTDIYSFFVTDTAGTVGVTSAPVSVTVTGSTPLAQPAAGTLTAVAAAPGTDPVITPVTAQAKPNA